MIQMLPRYWEFSGVLVTISKFDRMCRVGVGGGGGRGGGDVGSWGHRDSPGTLTALVSLLGRTVQMSLSSFSTSSCVACSLAASPA